MTTSIPSTPAPSLTKLLSQSSRMRRQETQDQKDRNQANLVQRSAVIATKAQIDREAAATRQFLSSSPMQIISLALTAKSLYSAGSDLNNALAAPATPAPGTTPDPTVPEPKVPDPVTTDPETSDPETAEAKPGDEPEGLSTFRIIEESVSKSKEFLELRLDDSVQHAQKRSKLASQIDTIIEQAGRGIEADRRGLDEVGQAERSLQKALAKKKW